MRVALALLLVLAASPEKERLFHSITPEALAKLERDATHALGPVYRFTLVKRERVKGTLLPPQTMRVLVRQEPFAVRAEVLSGPGEGRRLLYNPSLRTTELRVREAGMLGWVGAVWIDLDGSLAHKDTNHTVKDLGFTPLLEMMEKDWRAALPFGGLEHTEEGWNEKGHWCVRFRAPPGAKGLYAQSSRICADPERMLPVEAEISDANGLLETLEYKDIEPSVSETPDPFTLQAASL